MRANESRGERIVDDIWLQSMTLMAGTGATRIPAHPEFGDLGKAAAEAAEASDPLRGQQSERKVTLTTRNGKPYLRF